MLKLGRYILFAWDSEKIYGGFNDNCGVFETPTYALNFFLESSHCILMDKYQIIDITTLDIISEGTR